MGAETWDWVFSTLGYEEFVVVILDRTTGAFLLYEGPGQGAPLQTDVKISGGADTHGGLELFLTRDYDTVTLEVKAGEHTTHEWFKGKRLTRELADFYQLTFNEDRSMVAVRGRS